MATDYNNKEHRIVGTSAISAIDSFNRNKSRLETHNTKSDPRPRANSVEDAVRRGQRQVEQVKLKMSMQMDDKTFQTSMIDTQVNFPIKKINLNLFKLNHLFLGHSHERSFPVGFRRDSGFDWRAPVSTEAYGGGYEGVSFHTETHGLLPALQPRSVCRHEAYQGS